MYSKNIEKRSATDNQEGQRRGEPLHLAIPYLMPATPYRSKRQPFTPLKSATTMRNFIISLSDEQIADLFFFKTIAPIEDDTENAFIVERLTAIEKILLTAKA